MISGTHRDERLAARIKSLIRAVPDFPMPGIRFRDVMGLTEDAAGFRAATAALADRFRGAGAEVVVGIESRGFIFGAPVAQELGVGFVPVRKGGKLPGEVSGVDYDLEYGSARVEMQAVAITQGARVLLIDDLLATGGTAAAAVELIPGPREGRWWEPASWWTCRSCRGRNGCGGWGWTCSRCAGFWGMEE